MKRLCVVLGSILLATLAGCRHQPAASSPAGLAPPAYPSQEGYPGLSAEAKAGTASGIPQGARLISTEVGIASWYGTVYDHRRAADGTVYDQDAMTAASRTIPLGAVARVTNLLNGSIAIVKITDRGPFVPGRILDLSAGAARAMGLYRPGLGKVQVEAFAEDGTTESPGKWCVQIGAFLDPADARQLRNDLLRRHPDAKAISFTGPTGSWVRLTPATSEREQSEAIAATVRVPDPGVAAYVTRLN